MIDLELIEKRLSSNIFFIKDLILENGDIRLPTDEEEIENGQPRMLSDVVDDLEDIRQEIEEDL